MGLSTVITVPFGSIIRIDKQIIMTRSIPFALSIPSALIARDEMDTAAFDTMMEEGLSQAKAGHGYSLDEAFDLLNKDVRKKYAIEDTLCWLHIVLSLLF